jgi:Uri superfamily endonuclease
MSAHYSIYVLVLHSDVSRSRKMRLQNRNGVLFKGFLYVGMTGISVSERIENHLKGYKSCNLVRRFFSGEVYNDYTEHGILFDYLTAVCKEKEVADRLRAEGYSVYQN